MRVLQGGSREEARNGMLVGEASHPGLRSGARVVAGRAAEVLERCVGVLDFDLTQYDSDSNGQGNGRQSAAGQSQVSTVPAFH